MKFYQRLLAAVMCAVLAAVSLAPGTFAVSADTLSPEQRTVLAKTFEAVDYSSTSPAALRRKIDSANPLHLVTFYGGESLTSLWAAIPDNQKPFTVILLIPGNVLSREGSLDWLIEQSAVCRESAIPFAVQFVSGETFTEWAMPLAYIEENFCTNPYFMGLNCAELYNAREWRGEADGDMSQYIADAIALMAKHGAYFIWTDTNYFGEDGNILDWIESNNALYSAMKLNSRNVCMMNKESYGDADTYSVMLGLWLAGLIGNWGVSSDWWHWLISGYTSLFGAYDDVCEGEWERICNYPEAMYVESMVFVMSQGGTCFKSEAQYFSVAKNGKRVAGFEYATIPFLNKILDGTFAIPTREQVIRETRAAVVGMGNYPTFNYDFTQSNIYPDTGRYGIIPLLPTNLRPAERALFTKNGVRLIEKNESERYYKKLFIETDDNTYAVNTAGQIYWINNCENTDTLKTANVPTMINGAQSITISAGAHTYALVKEETARLTIHLGNYRTDKAPMVTSMKNADGSATGEAIEKWMTLDASGSPLLDDDTLRTTTVVINTDTAPALVSATGSRNRPFEHTEVFDAEKKTCTVTVRHNGAVDIVMTTKPGRAMLTYETKPEVDNAKNSVTGADYSVLDALVREYRNLDRNMYSPYSYSQFNKVYTLASEMISEGNAPQSEIDSTVAEFNEKSACLVYIGGLRALILALSGTDFESVEGGAGTRLAAAYDAALLELLSPTCYYDGKTSQLQVSEEIKNFDYNSAYTLKKERTLLEKYDTLRAATVGAGINLSAEATSLFPVGTRAEESAKFPTVSVAVAAGVIAALAVAAVLIAVGSKRLRAKKTRTEK